MTRRGTKKPDLWRCNVTEEREGRKVVRCSMSLEHRGPCRFDGVLFRVDAATIEAVNAQPVCGRTWFEDHPLDGQDYLDYDTGLWVPVIESCGHVCYEAKGHVGKHTCWDGAQAEEKLAAVVAMPRPQQTMMSKAA